MEKLQLSSMYGKFGDIHAGAEAERFKELIPAPVDKSTMQRFRELIEPIGQSANTPIITSSEISEKDMMDRLMDGVKVIPVDSIPQGSGKTSMLRESLQSALGDTDIDDKFVIIDEKSMLPENFEGFEPGKVVILDSMRALDHKSGVDIDTMRRLAMELDAQEPVQLRLTRTEKRKQQRARAAEERKLRKQLAKESKKTVHQTFEQTILENRKLEDRIIHENNQRTIKEIDDSIPELRGVGAGVYYDDQWEE